MRLYFVHREFFPPDDFDEATGRYRFRVPSWIVSIDGVDQVLVPVALTSQSVAVWRSSGLIEWTPSTIPGPVDDYNHDIIQLRTNQSFDA